MLAHVLGALDAAAPAPVRLPRLRRLAFRSLLKNPPLPDIADRTELTADLLELIRESGADLDRILQHAPDPWVTIGRCVPGEPERSVDSCGALIDEALDAAGLAGQDRDAASLAVEIELWVVAAHRARELDPEDGGRGLTDLLVRLLPEHAGVLRG